MELNEEMRKVTSDLEQAEDALIEAGFSAQHWALVKRYVWSAILSNQLATAKALQEMPPL